MNINHHYSAKSFQTAFADYSNGKVNFQNKNFSFSLLTKESKKEIAKVSAKIRNLLKV